MNALVFVCAFCIVALLVYMARFSGRLRVAQTRTIDAPLAAVFSQVADFRNWQPWNPWLEHEPEAAVTLTGPSDGAGGVCSWDLPRIGSGRIAHLRLTEPTLIEQRMDFAQPFRFRGRSRWRFTERAGGTEVTWSMRGRVGFSMRAFAKTVEGMVALDFRYGLDRLAAALEPCPTEAYSMVYAGQRDVPATRFAYIPYRGPLAGLAAAVRRCMAAARSQLAVAGVPECGDPAAIYVKTNVGLRTTECHIGLAVGEGPTGSLPVHELPAHRAYVVRLHGSRDALEVAWYHAMQRMRIENIEPDLRITPFERYLSDPVVGGASQMATELYIAVRPPRSPRPS